MSGVVCTQVLCNVKVLFTFWSGKQNKHAFCLLSMTLVVDLNRPYYTCLIGRIANKAIFGRDHSVSRGREPQLPRQGCFRACGAQRQPLCCLRALLQSDAVEQWAVSRGALLSTLGRGNLSRLLLTGGAAWCHAVAPQKRVAPSGVTSGSWMGYRRVEGSTTWRSVQCYRCCISSKQHWGLQIRTGSLDLWGYMVPGFRADINATKHFIYWVSCVKCV